MTSPSQHSTSSWNASKDSTLPRTCSGEAHPTATLAAQHDSTPRLKGMVNWFVGKLDSRNPLVCHHFLIKVTILRKYTVLVILHFQTNPTGYGWYCIVYIYIYACVCVFVSVCVISVISALYIYILSYLHHVTIYSSNPDTNPPWRLSTQLGKKANAKATWSGEAKAHSFSHVFEYV